MELGPLLPPELAAGHELRHVLSAAFFLEFDEDGSGRVDRAEFRNSLWMLTRASKAEKMRYAFARLDLKTRRASSSATTSRAACRGSCASCAPYCRCS